MSTESEQREIGFAAIIFWDFVDESNKDKLLTSLKELYGEEPDQYGGLTLGGGSWRTRVAGNDTNHIEDTGKFASVRTLVESNTRGVLDVTTFAVLPEKQIQMVLDKKDRTGLRELRSLISEYLEMLPTYVDRDDSNHCGLYYAEWSDGDILSDVEEVTDEDLVERLHSHHETLYSFGFQLGGNLSLYNGNFFVAPTATALARAVETRRIDTGNCLIHCSGSVVTSSNRTVLTQAAHLSCPCRSRFLGGFINSKHDNLVRAILV